MSSSFVPKSKWEAQRRYDEKIRREALENGPLIPCECGCGTLIPKFDPHTHRPRRFVLMHHLNRKGSKEGRRRFYTPEVTPPPILPGAACSGIDDPDIFFPQEGRKRGDSPPENVKQMTFEERMARQQEKLRKMERAFGLCGRCPVREECLEWAIEKNEMAGIWGGTIPAQRREMRRIRAQAQDAARRRRDAALRRLEAEQGEADSA